MGPPQRLDVFLAGYAPFDSLDPASLTRIADAATVERYRRGDLVLDAFVTPTTAVCVVLSGRVDVWNDPDEVRSAADERLSTGAVFGYSAMLTERRVGPRAVAATEAVVAAVPGELVAPAFASRRGARFLADRLSAAGRQGADQPGFSLAEDLVTARPLVVSADDSVEQVAASMTRREAPYAAVDLGDGRFAILTDAVLRRGVVAAGRPLSTPVGEVARFPVSTVQRGDPAVDALILMLDHDEDVVLVAEPDHSLYGALLPMDFVVSPVTAGVSLREQLSRASSTEELVKGARRVPAVLAELLDRGLASGNVVTVYSVMVDTIVRRAIDIVLRGNPDVDPAGFTWIALGSNGRREAVLSSDVDSAVALDDGVAPAQAHRYREVFASVHGVLTGAGLSGDGHGVTAANPRYCLTNEQWRAGARAWVSAPDKDNGAIMTSLLLDGRPIYGDPGLGVVTQMMAELRGYPGALRLLLEQSLSNRARLRSMKEMLTRRPGVFDLKNHAVVPLVNLARWVSLSARSPVTSTPERLLAAAGSTMLPQAQARALVDSFEALQRIRLRYQLRQVDRGEQPTDLLAMDRLTPIDRSVVAQAVHEIAAVQRRMANVAAYSLPEDWAAPVRS